MYVAAPSITSISPTSGPLTGGVKVTIIGTNLLHATAVNFGTTAVTSFISDSANQIQLYSPAGKGAVHVTVATAGGVSQTSWNDWFTYKALTIGAAISRPAINDIALLDLLGPSSPIALIHEKARFQVRFA